MIPMFYRIGQAAAKLGISPYQLRRLSEAGLVYAERTEGGQWQIPVGEVERLSREGVPPVPHPCEHIDHADEQPPGVGRFPNYASPDTVDAYDEALRLKAEIEALELEKQKELALDFFRDRRRKEDESQRAAKLTEERRRAEQRQLESQERRRRQWVDRAVWRVHEAPSRYQLLVKDAIAELIETLPPDLSYSSIEILVDAAIQECLEPWHLSERRKRAIATAVEFLPPDAKGRGTPTDWQMAAAGFAAAAIDDSCPTGTEDEMVLPRNPASSRSLGPLNTPRC